MTTTQIAMRSNYCGGCQRTVNLVPADQGEARCPMCGRTYSIAAPAPAVRLRGTRAERPRAA